MSLLIFLRYRTKLLHAIPEIKFLTTHFLPPIIPSIAENNLIYSCCVCHISTFNVQEKISQGIYLNFCKNFCPFLNKICYISIFARMSTKMQSKNAFSRFFCMGTGKNTKKYNLFFLLLYVSCNMGTCLERT